MLGQEGFDRVRGYEIGRKDVTLRYFEEVFTSEHWMVRIYAVRPVPNVEGAELANPGRLTARPRRPPGGSKRGAGKAKAAVAPMGLGEAEKVPARAVQPNAPGGWGHKGRMLIKGGFASRRASLYA